MDVVSPRIYQYRWCMMLGMYLNHKPVTRIRLVANTSIFPIRGLQLYFQSSQKRPQVTIIWQNLSTHNRIHLLEVEPTRPRLQEPLRFVCELGIPEHREQLHRKLIFGVHHCWLNSLSCVNHCRNLFSTLSIRLVNCIQSHLAMSNYGYITVHTP